MKLQITQDEYGIITGAGLMIDHVYVLQMMNNTEPSTIAVPESVVGMLKLKGFISPEARLTEKAEDLLGQLAQGETSPPVPAPDILVLFAIDLHAAMQMKLIQLTGKRQKTLSDGKYSFLCNAKDLEKKLRDVWRKYGPFDPQRVGHLLLSYIERCHKSGWKYATLVEYYIMKDGTSKLVTDLESLDEQQTQGAVEEVRQLIDPKTLF